MVGAQRSALERGLSPILIPSPLRLVRHSARTQISVRSAPDGRQNQRLSFTSTSFEGPQTSMSFFGQKTREARS